MSNQSKRLILFLIMFWIFFLYLLSHKYSIDVLLWGFFLAILPVTFWAGLALKLDIFEKEPFELLLVTFIWGATGAALLSLGLNTFLGGHLANLLEIQESVIATICVAPIVEELCKALILILFFFILPHHFNSFIDYIIYSVFVGLGFACTENIMYYTNVFEDKGFSELLTLFLLRGFGIAYIHPIFTCFTGISLYFSKQIKNKIFKVLFFIFGLLTAASVHGLWNYASLSGLFSFGIMFLSLYVPTIILMMIFIIYEVRKSRQLVRKNMIEFSEKHIKYLTSFFRRQIALWKELFKQGYKSMLARKCYHSLVFDVAIFREKSDPMQGEAEKVMLTMKNLIKGEIDA